MTLPHFFIYLFILILMCPLLSLFWMLIDTMFARDMYQVYEINDDWYSGSESYIYRQSYLFSAVLNPQPYPGTLLLAIRLRETTAYSCA